MVRQIFKKSTKTTLPEYVDTQKTDILTSLSTIAHVMNHLVKEQQK